MVDFNSSEKIRSSNWIPFLPITGMKWKIFQNHHRSQRGVFSSGAKLLLLLKKKTSSHLLSKIRVMFFFGWNSANFSLGRSVSFVYGLGLLSYLSTCLSTVSISPPIHASIYLSNLAITQSIRLSMTHVCIHVSVHSSTYLCIYLSTYLACLFIYLHVPVYLSII